MASLGVLANAFGLCSSSQSSALLCHDLLATLVSCVLAAEWEALSVLCTFVFAELGLLINALCLVCRLGVFTCSSSNLLAVTVLRRDTDSSLLVLHSFLGGALLLASSESQTTALLALFVLASSAKSHCE